MEKLDTLNLNSLFHLHQLAQRTSPCSVSIYMSLESGDPAGRNERRFKQLLDAARAQLESIAARDVVERMLRQGLELLFDDGFSHDCGEDEGLAVFCTPDFFHSLRIPLQPADMVVVGERFHLRPLLPLIDTGWRAALLELTSFEARLYEFTPTRIREIQLSALPVAAAADRELSEANVEAKPMHPSAAAKLEFFRNVDICLAKGACDERIPLVLACSEELANIYESTNTCARIVGRIDPEGTADEKRFLGWQIAQFDIVERALAAGAALATAPLELDVQAVASAAKNGDVDCLLVSTNPHDVHAQAGESAETAAIYTYCHGGEVYLLDSLPTSTNVAAILRSGI